MLTYHCKKSVAWYDNVEQNHNKALKLLGANEFEFDIARYKDLFKVQLDECKVSSLQYFSLFQTRLFRGNLELFQEAPSLPCFSVQMKHNIC